MAPQVFVVGTSAAIEIAHMKARTYITCWRVNELAELFGPIGERMAEAIAKFVSEQELPLSALEGTKVAWDGYFEFTIRSIPVTISFVNLQ